MFAEFLSLVEETLDGGNGLDSQGQSRRLRRGLGEVGIGLGSRGCLEEPVRESKQVKGDTRMKPIN